MCDRYCDLTDVVKETSVHKKQHLEQTSSKELARDDKGVAAFHKWFVNEDCNLGTNIDMMLKNIEEPVAEIAGKGKGKSMGKGTGKGGKPDKPEKTDPFAFETVDEGFDACKGLATILQNKGANLVCS